MPAFAPVTITVLSDKSAPLGMRVDPSACPTINCRRSLKVAIIVDVTYILGMIFESVKRF
jgi:hypothetical protein